MGRWSRNSAEPGHLRRAGSGDAVPMGSEQVLRSPLERPKGEISTNSLRLRGRPEPSIPGAHGRAVVRRAHMGRVDPVESLPPQLQPLRERRVLPRGRSGILVASAPRAARPSLSEAAAEVWAARGEGCPRSGGVGSSC